VFICGPFGAGKSTVTDLLGVELKSRGHEVVTIILDRIGHELLVYDEKLREILVESFGAQILDSEGAIDRTALAAAGFADAASLTALNAITHPPILARAVGQLAQHAAAQFCIFEAPLPFAWLERTPGYGSERLLEARENGLMVTVVAPVELRVQRVEAKGFSEADAIARMGAQPADEAYLEGADYRIDNTGDMAALRQSVSQLADTLCL